MDLLAAYATNADAEEKGRYFANGDVEFLIARSGNRAFNDMMNTQFQAHKHTLDQKDTPEAREIGNQRAEEITIMVMSRTILLGWRGVAKKNPDGSPMLRDGEPVRGKLTYGKDELAYSPAAAAKILAHKDFRSWVSSKADDFKNYLASVEAEDAKNSATTTTGS